MGIAINHDKGPYGPTAMGYHNGCERCSFVVEIILILFGNHPPFLDFWLDWTPDFESSYLFRTDPSGQIIATSHNLVPQNVAEEGKWDPLFQGNLGW